MVVGDLSTGTFVEKTNFKKMNEIKSVACRTLVNKLTELIPLLHRFAVINHSNLETRLVLDKRSDLRAISENQRVRDYCIKLRHDLLEVVPLTKRSLILSFRWI